MGSAFSEGLVKMDPLTRQQARKILLDAMEDTGSDSVKKLQKMTQALNELKAFIVEKSTSTTIGKFTSYINSEYNSD